MTLADYLLQAHRPIPFRLGLNNVLIQQGSLELVCFPGPQPLVSCLMVTRGKLFPARFAIECFQRQSYLNKELILVCDGPGTEIEHYCQSISDPRIRIIYPENSADLGSAPNSLGNLRNLSLHAARGEWICQWDDDDLYHPQRIALGMTICQSMQATAFFLSRWLLWSPSEKKIGISGAREWEGSMLAFKKSVPEYPGLARGEDTVVMHKILQSQRIVLVDSPWLYTYIQTGANTWAGNHLQAIWGAASVLEEDVANYEAAILAAGSFAPYSAYAHEFFSSSQNDK